MEIAAVLKFFGINSESSISQLNAAYSRYLQKYRPESNRGNEEWAIGMAKRLNDAYTVARDHLTAEEARRSTSVLARGMNADRNRSQPAQGVPDSRGGHPRQEEEGNGRGAHGYASALFGDQQTGRQSAAQDRFDFFNAFYAAVDEALEGIYTYYQYGLENIHLRHEGVRSYRFRSALRKVTAAAAALERLRVRAASPQDRQNLEIFTEFANAFLQNMRVEKIHAAGGPPDDSRAYGYYAKASRTLDLAIRDAFFEELRDSQASKMSSDSLELCTHQYMIILTEHLHSTWATEAAIKVYLLDVFVKLLNHSKSTR